MGQLLMKFIHAFAQASEEAKIFVAKWDIKDGVWRRDCLEGELLNSCYVLPQKEGEPVRLVVPMTLQMGWIEPPPYFCAASETGWDVAAQYVKALIGSLLEQKFINHPTHGKDFFSLQVQLYNQTLTYVIEVYVENFISLAILTLQE